jgi:hypothetical protein
MKKQVSTNDFEALMSLEIKQAYEEVQKDRREGRVRSATKNPEGCAVLMDLCLYVFKVARLNGEHQILAEGITVKRWVWVGHSFTDRFVKIVELVGPRLPDKDSLEELRLVATRVTASGAERLQSVFTKSKIEIYPDADHDRDWRLSQASFSGET